MRGDDGGGAERGCQKILGSSPRIPRKKKQSGELFFREKKQSGELFFRVRQ